MHGYFLTRSSLKKKIREFVGGQFLIITYRITKEDLERFMEINDDTELRALLKKLGVEKGEPLSYRGKIARIEMSPSKRELEIHCEWLCIQGKGLDQFGDSKPKWILVPKTKGCTQFIRVAVVGGYFPKKGKRVKVWTTLNMFTSHGEYCRLYKSDDADNLVQDGEEFVCPAKKSKV